MVPPLGISKVLNQEEPGSWSRLNPHGSFFFVRRTFSLQPILGDTGPALEWLFLHPLQLGKRFPKQQSKFIFNHCVQWQASWLKSNNNTFETHSWGFSRSLYDHFIRVTRSFQYPAGLQQKHTLTALRWPHDGWRTHLQTSVFDFGKCARGVGLPWVSVIALGHPVGRVAPLP